MNAESESASENHEVKKNETPEETQDETMSEASKEETEQSGQGQTESGSEITSHGCIYDQVRKALKDHKNQSQGSVITDEIIELIAAKTSANIIQMNKRNSESEDIKNVDWIDLGDTLACRSCLDYSKHKDVPTPLKATARFGTIKKNQQQNTINQSKKLHCEKPLHQWCQRKEHEELKNKADSADKNLCTGENIVRNALYCLKRGLGAQDFVGLNEKDLGSDIPNTATKNDRAEQSFSISEMSSLNK